MAKILLIDDVDATREKIARKLQAREFDITEARDGEEGLEKAKEKDFDIIICDVNMPKINGFKLLVELRNDPQRANTPFIFITGNTDREDVRHGMNIGADDYITKPFLINELVTSINSRLDRKAKINKFYESKIEEEISKIEQEAKVNPLTNLPNEHALEDRITEMTEKAQPGSFFAIYIIEINGYQNISDALGKESMKDILNIMANRLSLFNKDMCGLFHHELSNFALIWCGKDASGEKMRKDIEEKALMILKEIKKPILYNDLELYFTSSVGICYAELKHAFDENIAVYYHATIAKNHARESGGNTYLFYSKERKEQVKDHLIMQNNLYQAIKRNELIASYEPQVNIKDGKIDCFEALIRWSTPSFGIVSPLTFIPIAEEMGVIIDIGNWMIRNVCEQIKIWHKKGLDIQKIAVNISGMQFRDSNFIKDVDEIISKAGVDPKFLEFEITETTMLKNTENTIATLRSLKQRGISIAIDDFGTGYSSLAYLQQFPVDKIKIDRSFIKQLHMSEQEDAIVSAIINMAHNLNLTVIAEGIERIEQLDILKKKNCDMIQGYYITMPLNENGVEDYMMNKK